MASAVPIIVGAATVAAAGASVISSMNRPRVGSLPVMPSPKKATQIAEEERRKRIMAAKARGRASTILTGGMGLTEEAPVLRKTLGG